MADESEQDVWIIKPVGIYKVVTILVEEGGQTSEYVTEVEVMGSFSLDFNDGFQV